MLGNDFPFFDSPTTPQFIFKVIDCSQMENLDISTVETQEKIANILYNGTTGVFFTNKNTTSHFAKNLSQYVIITCKNVVAKDLEFIEHIKKYTHVPVPLKGSFLESDEYNRSVFFRPEHCSEMMLVRDHEIFCSEKIIAAAFQKAFDEGIYGKIEKALINTQVPVAACSVL